MTVGSASMASMFFVTRHEFIRTIKALRERMDDMSANQQSEIDAVTATVQQQGDTIAQVATDATAAQQQIQTELDSIEAQINQGQPVTLDALKAAVQANADALSPLDGAVQALGQLKPTPPAPAA